MDPALRSRFNAAFTTEQYAALVQIANESERWPVDFRISETPIFFTPEFTEEITRAAHEIVAQLRTPEFARHARSAIPPGLEVPDENPHPTFIQVDFGVCEDASGRLTPRLIELQAFPSLYAYQLFFLDCTRQAYSSVPRDWHSVFQRPG